MEVVVADTYFPTYYLYGTTFVVMMFMIMNE